MNWITSLLKHLGIARSVVVVVFMVTIVFYVGPRVAPDYVEQLQYPWSALNQAGLFSTACFLLIWAFSWMLGFLSRVLIWCLHSYRARLSAISTDEHNVLHALGLYPNSVFDVNTASYRFRNFDYNELDLMQILTGLCKKGLVEQNFWNPSHFTLTERGQRQLFKINGLKNSKL